MKVNDPCPCGSGKKYKRCCKDKPQPESLSPNQLKVVPLSEVPPALLKPLQEKKVIEEQRIAQQGYGRPIISAEVNGRRLIEIGSDIFDSGNCKTFHDVLTVYLGVLLGEEWLKNELKKESKARHPILKWHHAMVACQRETIQTQEVRTVPTTGAISALLGLSYNLYLLAHNVELQEKLINRLKDQNNFLGARYETQVAAFFIRAGFKIALEDEGDPSSTHCEFTATHPRSGRKFSVEAKARMPGKDHGKINRQLFNALKKFAEHERIVFIDVNMPKITTDVESTKWIKEAICDLRNSEKKQTIKEKETPPAYVFLTNHQNAYNLNSTTFDIGVVAESFKIPDFQNDASFTGLREMIDARDKHKEVIDLFELIKTHHQIPATFDGEIPEFAFGENELNEQRLIVGNKYTIPDDKGNDTIGILLDPIVIVENGRHIVYATYKLENGRMLIRNELKEEEVSAYKQHPDTFFVLHKQQTRKTKHPIELYDFFFESYSKSSKENLLQFMKNYPNYNELVEMTQEELAKLYCEVMTNRAIERGNFKNPNK